MSADPPARGHAARAHADRELEAALIVCSEDSGRVLADLASARGAGQFVFLPLAPQHIRDRYFDTASGDLARHLFALRVRDTGTEVLLTLKGPDGETASLGKERLELEAPWSPETLQRLLDELARRTGISIAPSAIDPDEDPGRTLALLGFLGIQERRTMRQRRNVIPRPIPSGRGPDAILAELALDDVEYGEGGAAVRLREVEIEARGEAGAGEVHDIARSLLERSEGALRPWPYSKLATGRAIEALRSSRDFAATLAPDASLTPDSLMLLERTLASDQSARHA
jgi:inorganic triphosphatase YgiF